MNDVFDGPIVTTVNPDVFMKLGRELEDLQQKYEFERYAKEKWEIVAESWGLRSPEALDDFMKHSGAKRHA